MDFLYTAVLHIKAGPHVRNEIREHLILLADTIHDTGLNSTTTLFDKTGADCGFAKLRTGFAASKDPA